MQERKLPDGVEERKLPDGTTLFFTTNPDVVLSFLEKPYHFTGVIDRTWVEACQIVGRPYTDRERGMGWPCAMEPHRLACLQAPHDPTGQTYVNTAMEGGCRLGRLPCTPFERHDYEILKNGERKLVEVWIDYAIAPQTFLGWLTNQREQPSRFIEAWFKANGLHWDKQPAPAAATPAPAPAPAPEPEPAAPAGQQPDNWWDATKDYMAQVTRTQRLTSAKDLIRHLHTTADKDSPFEPSTEVGRLYVAKAGRFVTDKTITNRWKEVRALAHGNGLD